MRPLIVVMLLALLLTFAWAVDRTKRDANDEDEGEDESDEDDDDDDDDIRRTTTTPSPYIGMPCTTGTQCGSPYCCHQPSPSEPATCQWRGYYYDECDTRVVQDTREIIPELVQLLYCPCYTFIPCLPSEDPSSPPNTGSCGGTNYYYG